MGRVAPFATCPLWETKLRVNHTIEFVLKHGYLILFCSVLAEQMGLPIPALPMLLAMGALAGVGDFSYGAALLAALTACLIADGFWYWLGVYRGASILKLLCKISLEPDSCVRRTENVFLRYGERGLLFAKFVPGLSAAAAPLAGMFRWKLWRFALFDGLGALFWAGAYSGLGYLFRTQLEDLFQHAMLMGSWLVTIVVSVLASYILWKYTERRRFYRELRISRITPEEVFAMIESGTPLTVFDLRNALEWQEEGAAKLPGAVHMSFEELEQRLSTMPLADEVVLYCT